MLKPENFSSFLSSGAPKFTKTPQNPFLTLESDNITLEWRYTFVGGESFFSASFRMGGRKVVNKFIGVNKPIIQRAYRSRLYANMTDDYASITLLGVNRLDKGSYTLEVSSLPDVETNISAVEMSVQCKYKVTLKNNFTKGNKKSFQS